MAFPHDPRWRQRSLAAEDQLSGAKWQSSYLWMKATNEWSPSFQGYLAQTQQRFLNIPGPLSCLFQSLCFWGIFEEESWKRWLPVYLPRPSGQTGLRPTDTILGGCLCLSRVLNTEL